ncbi:MAG: FAD-dependent oxidoreductase [Acidobacteriota bacterium]
MGALNRRDFLTLALGAPLAAAACARGTSPRLPDGIIVGASDRFGHQLRDRRFEWPGSDRQVTCDVAIVGAGVAGLTAARALHRAGVENLIVLELEPELGGTSRSGHGPLCAYPWGAHYIPLPTRDNPALIELLTELGAIEGRDAEDQPIAAEPCLVRDPDERVFYRGRWYEGLWLQAGASDADRAELLRFQAIIDQWSAWRDARGRRAFTVPLSACSDDVQVTALDRESFSAWLSRHDFQSPRLLWWTDYACRDDYGLRAHETSAWAGLFYFAARLIGPGRQEQPLLTWPEGNARLVAALAAPVHDRIRTGWAAAELVVQHESIDVLAVSREHLDALAIRAKQVIVAAPQFIARRLIRSWRDNPPLHLDDFQYGAWLVANLTLYQRPSARGFPLAWDNVLYESPALGYVVATHQTGPEVGPTVLTYYHALADHSPSAAREQLLSAPYEQLADAVLADLEMAHRELREITTRLDVMRWGHAMIQPRPGFVWGPARSAAARPYRGIHFAHSDLSGLALFEEAFDRGHSAANAVVAELGREPRSA